MRILTARGIKFLVIFVAVIISLLVYQNNFSSKTASSNLKLYWFIPDGVRAEPGLFNVYEWAQEGKLPNIKKMMDKGSYGYAYPNFPSHTPTNFATLLTGAYPEIHGVDDGPMHEIGKPLDKVAVAGFRSVAKKVEPIWKNLEDAGYKVSVLSVPGSTPPEINKGNVIRGRWGGWGADFYPLNFESKGDLSQRIKQGRAAKLFYFGAPLTQYLDGQNPQGWINPPKSYSESYEINLTGWGGTVYGYAYDSTDDKKTNISRIGFSVDKKSFFSDLKQGEWSNWQPLNLVWKVENQEISVPSSVKLAIIKLGDNKFFRIRALYDSLNKNIIQPASADPLIRKAAGPMVDFSDNFPPQLVYYPEDKKIFMDESDMSFDWHKKAVPMMINDLNSNIVIHDIYTPNQMLTSKWWMGYIDPQSANYNKVSDKEREKLWEEVKNMYKKVDDIVGEILKNSDKNTFVVFSSDHGAVPLDKRVNLNNLFAKNGWLKFKIDPLTGEPIIDWKNSQVIYLKMAHVYINPLGLDGNYERASGKDYEELRNKVIKALEDLKDDNGKKPVVQIVKWENVKKVLRLDPDRAGDLVIANMPGYGWGEEMSNDLAIFSKPLETGYKQAIKAENVPGMWTPFIIMGPGIKENNFMGNTPFELINEYPTLMNALKVEIPDFVQGKTLPVFK